MELAERVKDLYIGDEGVMYREGEFSDGMPPSDAVLVEGIVRKLIEIIRSRSIAPSRQIRTVLSEFSRRQPNFLRATW